MDNTNRTSGYYSPEDLRNVLRQLWSQYSLWTRFYMVSKMASLDDLEVVSDRLYRVPIDISNLFLIYYNQNSVQELENLFREQVTLTIRIIDEITAGQNINTTQADWRANAGRISLLLTRLNPNWNLQTLENLFYNHLDMVVDEAQKRVTRQYSADVFAYNFIEYHTLMTADYIWNGIINQFYPR